MASDFTQNIFISSDGVHEITAYMWKPLDMPVVGVVQIVHGMREHMGRYADFAAFLNAMGFVVCGHDHLGHGESAKKSGGYGYFGSKNGAKHLVSDCRRMTGLIRRQYPDAPLFLFGHSMGSFISRIYVTKFRGNLSGFICAGTGSDIPLAPLGRALAWGLSRIGLESSPGNLLERIAFGKFKKHYPDEELEMAWLSRDAKIAEEFDLDEHTKEHFTYGGFRDMLDLQMAACGKNWFKRVPKELPVFLISGAEDPVGGYGKGVSQVHSKLCGAGLGNVSLKLYENARHELLNEINKEEIYFDIYRWMEENM